jgi:hypothetical protein
MSSEALGGGVMVAIAATLWVAYLMPTWSRRRQYLAVERNAVRLQQTMRILAETAEVPEPVRLEANARTVRTQQRILAEAEESARLEAKAATDAARAARRLAAETAAAARAPVVVTPAVRLRRLRKRRALSSLVLLVGIVLVVAGMLPAMMSGSWQVVSVGAVLAVAALVRLTGLAPAARAARVVAASPVPVPITAERFEPVQLEQSRVPGPTWTPQPLPKPLYLARGSIAQAAMASVDAAAELRKAAAEAELARRAAQLAAQTTVTPIARPAARVGGGSAGVGAGASAGVGAGAGAGVGASAGASPSRFASMGIVGETEPGMADLDAVLRRRRAVG